MHVHKWIACSPLTTSVNDNNYRHVYDIERASLRSANLTENLKVQETSKFTTRDPLLCLNACSNIYCYVIYNDSNNGDRLRSCPNAFTDGAALMSVDSESSTGGGGVYRYVYEGAWKDGKRNGFGVLRVDKQYTYSGEWVNNQREGLGSIHYHHSGAADKKDEVGRWRDDKLEKRVMEAIIPGKAKKAQENATLAMQMAREKAIIAKKRVDTARKCERVASKEASKAAMAQIMYKGLLGA